MALIALGVGGGIGAYKAVEVARGLQKNGHEVVAVLTRNARRFITPLTFEAITRRRVLTSQFEPGVNAGGGAIEHISVANDIALLLVAPATANILARFAHGLADDYLSTLYLATPAPVLLAPAMNTRMLEHPAVQENARVLAARGVQFVDPGAGYLACGWIGKGRLAEPAEIVAAAEAVLNREIPRSAPGAVDRVQNSRLKLVVTAGPTYEDIDPVRFIGNRSSGRMGYAVAAEALKRGASVTLITGPSRLDPPAGANVVRVRSAREMRDAVRAAAAGAGAVVMAAAVADYMPADGARDAKIEKRDGHMHLTLARTPDILAELGATRSGPLPVLVGFAAQTGDPLDAARRKLAAKRIDLVVGNDIAQPGAGFDVETNEVTLVSQEEETRLPLMSKDAVAAAILDRVDALLSRAAAGAEPNGAAIPAVPAASDDLDAIRLHIGPDCARCKLHTLGRRQIVFGVGNPNAELMFVGEAPGADEDEQGVPFVGRAGQLLTKIIEAIGLTRDDVYIANVIKCRPPGNRNPEPDEVAECEPFLFRQIDAIQPKVIVALGTFAAKALLKSDLPISRLRGQFYDYRGAKLLPTFHPAFLLRSPDRKRDVWEDMKKVRAVLNGEPAPVPDQT